MRLDDGFPPTNLPFVMSAVVKETTSSELLFFSGFFPLQAPDASNPPPTPQTKMASVFFEITAVPLRRGANLYHGHFKALIARGILGLNKDAPVMGAQSTV